MYCGRYSNIVLFIEDAVCRLWSLSDLHLPLSQVSLYVRSHGEIDQYKQQKNLHYNHIQNKCIQIAKNGGFGLLSTWVSFIAKYNKHEFGLAAEAVQAIEKFGCCIQKSHQIWRQEETIYQQYQQYQCFWQPSQTQQEQEVHAWIGAEYRDRARQSAALLKDHGSISIAQRQHPKQA